MIAFTTTRKPSAPPGTLVSSRSTHRSPSTPRNTRLKTVEPMRMNITKLVISAVDSSACLSSEKESLRLTSAMAIAPEAPIAPPSVGVATPRKMVPSTRKISTSGGIMVVKTRPSSAMP